LSKDKDLLSDLVSIVGKENASVDVYERFSYSLDPMPHDLDKEVIPSAVVRPKSVQEASKLLKYANERKIPVMIQGAGTNFVGAVRPKRKGSIVLNTSNLNFLEINEEDCYFEAGAGVVLFDLEMALLKRGYMLPSNIGSKKSATIGGAVAVNTIGHMVDASMGKTIDHILSVEAVLPNGEIVETGTTSLRRPAGIDLTRFFAGTEGIFGVITKIRMRLLPDPKKAYVAAFFKDPADVGHAFTKVYQEKLPPPMYGEFLEEDACVIGFEIRGLGKPKGSMALATTTGYTQEDADLKANEILRVFRDFKPVEAHIIKSREEQEKLWAARDFITNLQQREPRGTWVAIEVGLPVHALAEAIEYLRKGPLNLDVLKDCKMYLYGHIGACSVHALWIVPKDWPSDRKYAAIIETRKLEDSMHLKWGGIGGEVGQTSGRISFYRRKYGEAAYTMLTNVKKVIDPNNILNPGNLEGEGYEY